MTGSTRWEIRFYSDEGGHESVREWIEALEKKVPREYGRVRHHLDLLEEFGVPL